MEKKNSVGKIINKAINTAEVSIATVANKDDFLRDNQSYAHFDAVLKTRTQQLDNLKQSFTTLNEKLHNFAHINSMTSRSFQSFFGSNDSNYEQSKEYVNESDKFREFEKRAIERIQKEVLDPLKVQSLILEEMKTVLKKYGKNIVLKNSAESKRDEIIAKDIQKGRDEIVRETTKRELKVNNHEARLRSVLDEDKSWDELVCKANQVLIETTKEIYAELDANKEEKLMEFV